MISKWNKIARRVLPILEWVPNYDVQTGISDLIAGITVGLTLIPQSLAYAALAGLSPEYGLYSSICGGIIYTIFGTIPQISIAPSALLSLLTLTYTHNASFGVVPAAIILCFLSGIIEVLCGILKLGFLIDFVSTPVVAGFTSAGAIIAATAQAKNILGLNFSAENFLDVWINVYKCIENTNQWDAILSAFCCVTLLGLREIGKHGSPPVRDKKSPDDNSRVPTWKIALWLVSVSRNAILVLVCALMAYVFEMYGMTPFSLTNKVTSGLPNLQPPPFTVQTENATYAFTDIVMELGSGIIVVPFIGILGNIAIAKSFAQGKVVDASQEMLSLGFCNIVSSFLSSMPINASFSRGAVSNTSGVKTTMGGIYTGVMVVFALTFLTPYFPYIPRATLASVIMCAVLFMVEIWVIKPIWKINRADWLPLWGTFITCLIFGMEIGILIGVGIDILLLLYYNARPKVTTEKLSDNGVCYLKVTPASAVLYPSAEYVREAVLKASTEEESRIDVVVLDCSHVSRADYTSAKCIASLAADMHGNRKSLVLLKSNDQLTTSLKQALTVDANFVENEEHLFRKIAELQECCNGGPNNHVSIEMVPKETGANNCIRNNVTITEF